MFVRGSPVCRSVLIQSVEHLLKSGLKNPSKHVFNYRVHLFLDDPQQLTCTPGETSLPNYT